MADRVQPGGQFLPPSLGGGIKGAKSPELAEGSGFCHPELAKDLVSYDLNLRKKSRIPGPRA